MSLSRSRRLGTAGVAVLAALVLGGAPASAAPPRDGSGDEVVATSAGAVRGHDAGTVARFLGIPYAAPPTGPLRWRPPQPVGPWTGVRDATAFAPHCAQPATPLGFGTASTSEDCLYLNVFAPARRAPYPRPVLVWIHGGGLVTGESDDYDPAKLVGDGTVVVTFNYRLGLFGFLAHPALAEVPGGPSGDYGLMDQQAALRWVRANIRYFGGDPGNVTIFGESAGGLSVLSQLASPTAHGLFDKAIAESGAYTLTLPSLADAQAAGTAVASAAGCPDQTAACLRALPVPALLRQTTKTEYRPDVDGLVLTESPGTAFAGGRFNRVPVVNGSNRDEYRLFTAAAELGGRPVTPASYAGALALLFGSAAVPAILAQYPLASYPSAPVAFSAAATDATFACLGLAADASLSAYVPTYAYEFADENAPELFQPPVSFPYGAAHGSELQYLFDLPNVRFPGALTPDQQRLAAAMRRHWTGFARFGQPWPHFDVVNQRVESLVPPRPGLTTDFASAHHCGFWRG